MLKRAWVISAILLVAGGCSESTVDPSIDGEIKIELPSPEWNGQGAMPEVFVFLGDGKTHLAQVKEGNQVTFTDPAIRGPQDITVVWSHLNNDGSRSGLRVYTAFQVNRRDVFLEPYFRICPGCMMPLFNAGRLTARLRGLSQEADTSVSVRVFDGEHLLGAAQALSLGTPFPDGTQEVTVHLLEKPTGPFSLVAHETDPTGNVSRGVVLARDLTMASSGDTVLDVELASPPAMESVFVDVGVGSRESAQAFVALRAHGIGALATGGTGTLPMEVKTVALQNEWADFSRTVCLQRHGTLGWSQGAGTLHGTSARIDLLDLPAIVAPNVAPLFEPVAPPEISAAEPFVLQWRADPSATAVRVTLAPRNASATQWIFEAPSSRTLFSPPAFPEALAHLAPSLVGEYEVSVTSMLSEKITHYSARFVQRTLEKPSCGLLDGGSQTFAFARGRFIRR